MRVTTTTKADDDDDDDSSERRLEKNGPVDHESFLDTRQRHKTHSSGFKQRTKEGK